jgi:hypothetical protein
LTFQAAIFEELQGQTLTAITINDDRDEVLLTTATGAAYQLWHDQCCCEQVVLEDVCGDLADLIGTPILLAEVVSNDEAPIPTREQGFCDPGGSFLWTFYKLSTIRGSVTLRWLGHSNGYYSIEVDFARVVADAPGTPAPWGDEPGPGVSASTGPVDPAIVAEGKGTP